MPEETTLSLDQPSSLDFVYENVFGSDNWIDKDIVFLPQNIQNQGLETETKMWCSRFGMAHIINAQNKYIGDIVDEVFPECAAREYWFEYLKQNPQAEKNGATLQSALDQFKKSWLITGYSVCNEIDSMKESLTQCRLIYTGSQNGDWKVVRDKKVYALRNDSKVVGHIFCIVGYNDSGWIAINSYGANNGVFSIPFDLTSSLFTRYSVSDSKDELLLINYHHSIMDAITIPDANLALIENIWNGLDPQKPATREEVAAMIYRATKE